MRGSLFIVVVAFLFQFQVPSPAFAEDAPHPVPAVAPALANESQTGPSIRMSDYNPQTPGGALDVTPFVSMSGSKTEYNNVEYKKNKFLATLGARAEYAFNNNFSVLGSAAMGKGSTSFEDCAGATCNGTSEDGLTNPFLKAKSKLLVGPGAIRADLVYSFSPQDREIDAEGDSNLFSGGDTLRTDLGYEVYLGPHVFGGLLSYDLMNGDRKVDDAGTTPTKSTVSDGHSWTLSGFYEYQLPTVTIGGAYYYGHADETKTSGTGNGDELSFSGFEAYTAIYLAGGKILLLPWLTVGSKNFEDPAISKTANLSLSFATRFRF